MKYKYTDYRLGLASNIKHYRLKAGYTQEQLAEKVGIGSKHLSRMKPRVSEYLWIRCSISPMRSGLMPTNC